MGGLSLEGPRHGRAALSGRLTLAELGKAKPVLDQLCAEGPVSLDLAGLDRLDTAGAYLLLRLAETGSVTLEGANSHARGLLDVVAAALPEPPPSERRGPWWSDRLVAIGAGVVAGAATGRELLGMLGLILARTGGALLRPRRFPLTALVAHAEAVGWRAVPIVALMSFLIGVVLAFQGATQLRQFGAEVFVVDLIAISILRELGIVLTSIIVAGRTASAFCAAIGSMKMREEIDAMRTLALDPALMLFVPRVMALVLTLPILGLIADLAGLFGGALMAWLELGISPTMFLTRLADGDNFTQAAIGLAKAPVFALIIGVVGCHAGMRVKSSAESLGRRTSGAVVTAIFSVIVADAIFSVFFAELGL